MHWSQEFSKDFECSSTNLDAEKITKTSTQVENLRSSDLIKEEEIKKIKTYHGFMKHVDRFMVLIPQ